ncbi:MAG: DoxX family protein [Planctomycetaceae bacterium]|nr:DoxX family protein [Planctomycetaceae bacterium]
MTTQSTTPRDRSAVETSLLIVRVVAGVIFAAHGGQKLFGWWGGKGIEFKVEMMGLLAWPVSIGEFFGGVGLIVGFLTRFSAASLIVIMVGAIATVHGKHGLFLQNSGFEYNLALIGLLAPTMLAGPGCCAIGHSLPLPRSKRSGRPVVVLE